MRSILSKLNANDRLDAVLIAMKRGILGSQRSCSNCGENSIPSVMSKLR